MSAQDRAFPADAFGQRYRIERELGHGGMATVYLAEDTKHGRHVALKVLKPEIASTLGPERFLREIRVAANLTHPHIVALYDSGESDGLLYYVMPYVEGETLREKLDREQQLAVDEAVSIASQVAAALDHAHARGLIHRDIKPENILLRGDEALVTDFGIALALRGTDAERMTEPGMSVGTLRYMSPEQASGDRDVDERTDLYSLGCVLYEMLAGEPPFSGPTAQAVLAKIASQQPAGLRALRSAVPPPLADAVHRALERRPVDRFASAHAFRQALAGTEPASARPRRAPRFLRPAPAVALVLAAGGIGWWLQGRRFGTSDVAARPLDPTRVAVLWFDDLTPGAELGHLADGFTVDLIHELAQVGRLDVIPQNGVRPYRETDVGIDSIARALDAGTVVSGSLEAPSGRLRAIVQLIDGASGRQLESSQVERAGTDLLALRDEIVREVADLLRQRLGEEIRLRERRAEAADDSAWALVQRAQRVVEDGRDLFAVPDVEAARRAYDRADTLLIEAEARAPDWIGPTLLRARIARSRADWGVLLGLEQDDLLDMLRVAKDHADRALAADSVDPEALGLRGSIFTELFRFAKTVESADGFRDAGERDLLAALETGENRAAVLSAYSDWLQGVGRFAEAREAAREALEADEFLLDAIAVARRLCSTSLELNELAGARRHCAEGRRRFPSDPDLLAMQFFVDIEDPDVGRAWSRADSLTQMVPGPAGRIITNLMMAGVLAASRPELRDSAMHVLERVPVGQLPGVNAKGALYLEDWTRLKVGQPDSAVAILRRFLEAFPGRRDYIAKDYAFADLRGHPEFQALVGGG
jgi:TolB-like protein